MDKAKKELKQKLVDKFNIDFTHPEYTSGDKQLFYALFVESCDEYEGSQKECTSLKITIDELRGFNANQMNQIETLKAVHTREIKSLEEVKIGQKRTIDALEEELVKVRSTVDKLTKQQAEDQNALALAHEEIQGAKEVAAEWEHRSKSVRKIPFLGTDTLSYQSDFILRFKDHTKEWNDLVSDFQNKYLPTLKESIDSFVTRVKNVEI
jgi:chromosome segregation ATPase